MPGPRPAHLPESPTLPSAHPGPMPRPAASHRSRIGPLLAGTLLVAAIGIAACGREAVPPGGPTAAPTTAASSATTRGPATTSVTGSTTKGTAVIAPGTVVIQDYEFHPVDLEVKVGETVTWVNQDGFNHFVISIDRQIDSGLLVPGASYSKTFTAPGQYPYYCDIHNYMKGTVTVH